MRNKINFCIKVILFMCLIFGAAICVVCLNVIQDKSVDNKDYYPIQIGQAEYVETITIEVGSNSGTISEKEDIEAFIEYIENLKMKKGNVEVEYEDPSICIMVEYKEEYQGEKLDYCRGIGRMIKLSESSYDAYNISDEDYKIFLEYMIKLSN